MPFNSLLLPLILATSSIATQGPVQSVPKQAGPAVIAHAAPKNPLADVLGAELALLDEDYWRAAELYASAARRVERADFAERAARIALHTQQAVLAAEMAGLWAKRDPQAAGAKQLQAAALIQAKRSKAALVRLRELLRDPEHSALALEALRGAPRKRGLSLLRALQADPGWQTLRPSESSPVAMALRWRDIALAKELAESSLAKHPDSSRAHLWRAAVALSEKRTDDATSDYEAALKLDSANVSLRISFVQLLAQTKQLDRVRKVLREAPQSDSRLYAVALSLAVSEGKKSEYRALSRQIERDRTIAGSERAYLLGQLAELQQKPRDALAYYREVNQEPQIHDASLRIAVLSFETDPQAARLVLRALQDSGVEQAHAAFMLEAELDAKAKDIERATETLTRALEAYPDDVDVLYARALHFAANKQLAPAEADLRRVLRVSPRNVPAMNALGYTLLTLSDRLDEAGPMIEAAAALNPTDPAILDSLGWLHYRRGDPEKALPVLQSAYALSKDAEIAAHLGEVLWQLKRKQAARKIWASALREQPSHEVLLETIQRLAPDLQAERP